MKKPFTNESNSPMYVAGVMVPPGEVVLIEVPDEHAPAEGSAPLTLAEQVALLLKDSVKAIGASLDALNDDTLVMMASLEGAADKPRTSLLAAIGNEQLSRADQLLADPHGLIALGELRGDERLAALVTAQNEHISAVAALDASADTDEHPALQAAVDAAQARIDVLAVADK